MAVWDIAELPAREQFGYWREVICEAFVPLTPHRTTDLRGFAATVETKPLAALNRARIAAQAQRTDHGPREVARTAGEYFFVNLQLAGRCVTTVGDRTSVVRPGEFVVVDTTEPYFFRFDRAWRMVSFRVPHDALGGRRPELGRPVAATGAGAAVTALMSALWTVDADAPGAVALADSFAAAVAGATAAPAPDGVSRDAVLAYVDRHLGDRDLTVHGVCRRFAISPRTLHNLFAGADESFAAAVRGRRLERCASLLADPATTATVTAVAAAHGFDDPTSFSRAFRRRFGVSPREMRP
ncbi:AraC family transcriptional regulator [Actinomycetospora succinea]|uniref:AraC family transcriptional regulator n=1 Tax=Actinomycetospora succinea TaxID=663603 RepID=A0A4R6UYZ3_9PSEU|nr:helix-turn-helix domain-containing protein [Actinomycetospora succinea]TDQ50825.1 AraC family transcriptional regulator [Actinomycetospora succinea]